MVAASSKNSQCPPLLSSGRAQRNSSMKGSPHIDLPAPELSKELPAVDTCITHLRLLAAFFRLKQSIHAQDGLFETCHHSSPMASDLKWAVFVANAVERFETWIRALMPTAFKPFLTTDVATNPRAMDALMDGTQPMEWTADVLPPLDVLTVLHSYMLNPHDFLEDCLRCGGMGLWKAGFPWDLVSKCINSSTLQYEPHEMSEQNFEAMTGLAWNPLKSSIETHLTCPGCSNRVPVAFQHLYSEESSHMEKGNTLMTFEITCSGCRKHLTQDSLTKARLKADLALLLNEDVVMPGSTISKDGLIPTARSKGHVEAGAALFNLVLHESLAAELIGQLETAQRENGSMRLSSCAMNDAVISTITEGSLRERIGDTEKADTTFQEIINSARRMRSVYEANFSPFTLDLVGAVIRQGVFVEKMQYFDWIHSPSVEHTVSCAIKRYIGFFKVLQQNPNKTAVPTFDVDLIWHTQQLSPSKYYKYSLENCNNIFMDHDDKIVDDVLSNSFDWTCDQFANLTGEHYDKCLCWCCAILEQDSVSRKPCEISNKKLSSQLRGMLKRLRKDDEATEAEEWVVDIQSRKFENDYATERQRAIDANENHVTKKAFFDSYIWHYPRFAPHPEELGAK